MVKKSDLLYNLQHPIQGVLRINQKNYEEGFVDDPVSTCVVCVLNRKVYGVSIVKFSCCCTHDLAGAFALSMYIYTLGSLCSNVHIQIQAQICLKLH